MKPSLAAALATLCTLSGCAATVSAPPAPVTLDFPASGARTERASFTQQDHADGRRSFVQSSTMAMREGAPSSVRYADVAGQPAVHSASLAFDALFTHAVAEMGELSVQAIRDGAYNDDQPIACDCFETGEKWHYVWTRDLSYAANLGLAMLDPRRVRNSLQFKLAGYRDGVPKSAAAEGTADGLQILQDTGSGGSWPVSTDRVSWAFGAEAALQALAPAERAAFAVTALRALSNTIDNDRIAAFDPRDGLYTGEQSFLDWREQSYGRDIETDLARMATSKALSTNVAHYQALHLAAQLAREQGEDARSARYAAWAQDLKAAINRRFWRADAGLYASITAAHGDGAPLAKYDWLGLSLAIVTGVADEARRDSILARYPHGPVGAPVIYPQQQGVPVYHNRAIWPFVTAYGLDAAIAGANVRVADAAYESLLRGAALHLSNMENMEWLSGQAAFGKPDDGTLGGPVINSRRQLWSVGAYIGMVVRDVFGVRYTDAGVQVRPFITARLRRETLGASHSIALGPLHVRGKTLRVRVALPPAAPGDGYYAVDQVTLDGKRVAGTLAWDQLRADSLIEVRLGALLPGRQQITRVTGEAGALSGPLFAPHEARIARALHADGGVDVTVADTANTTPVQYRLYRNGVLVADGLARGLWRDRAPLAQANCYAVEAFDPVSGNASHHSGAVCAEPGMEIGVADARVASSVPARDGRVANWGAPHDTFVVHAVTLAAPGRYSFQLRYKNTSHAINTGISNAVKVLSVRDAAGHTVARRVIQMPHLPPASAPMYSTPADIVLKAGTYTVRLDDFYNMSYLQANASYAHGGGKGGPLNRADLHGLRVLRLE